MPGYLIFQTTTTHEKEEVKYLSTEIQEEVMGFVFNLFAPHPTQNVVMLTNNYHNIVVNL